MNEFFNEKKVHEFMQRSGFILGTPTNPDYKKIDNCLKAELEQAKAIPLKERREVIVSLIETAISTYKSSTGRILRFYKHYNAGCPNDVNLDSCVPKQKIEKPFSWFNEKS